MDLHLITGLLCVSMEVGHIELVLAVINGIIALLAGNLCHVLML